MLLQERLAEFKISSSGKLQGFLIWVEAAFSRSEPFFSGLMGISPVVLKQSQQPTESWIQQNSLKCCITVLSDVWFGSTRSFHLVTKVTACHSPALWMGYNHPILVCLDSEVGIVSSFRIASKVQVFNLFQDAFGFEKRDIAGQLPRFLDMVDCALPADSWFSALCHKAACYSTKPRATRVYWPSFRFSNKLADQQNCLEGTPLLMLISVGLQCSCHFQKLSPWKSATS